MTSLSPPSTAASADPQDALKRCLTSPEALALLATWVESPAHLASGLTRSSDAGGEPEVLERLRTVSKLLNACPGHPLSPGGSHRNGGHGFRASASTGDIRDPRLEGGAGPSGEAVQRAAWPSSGESCGRMRACPSHQQAPLLSVIMVLSGA